MSRRHEPSSPALTHLSYTVGWVCALPKEQTAAKAMLDEIHPDLPSLPGDGNAYILGRIGEHNVVIACLPKGKVGNNSSATVAARMTSTFTSIRVGLMVGIGGGVPPKVRLGDVVVSIPTNGFGGVVQWDFGKAVLGDGTNRGETFKRTGALNSPPAELLAAAGKLETKHDFEGSMIPKYLEDLGKNQNLVAKGYTRSDSLEDVLFRADYDHVESVDENGRENGEQGRNERDKNCPACDRKQVVRRPMRKTHEAIVVHYGLIASGNQVIKNAAIRDEINRRLEGEVLCFDMEAAGLGEFPCLVIRGICDYADSHKNKDWQEYAAAVAAAYAKELLLMVPVYEIVGMPHINRVKPIQMIPFARNEDIVIREAIFSELEKKLSRSLEHQSAALWGLGGSGKTQIALEYAYRRQAQTSCSVFWVHADNYARFSQDYGAIARLVGLPAELKGADMLVEVRRWIESQPCWLLVLDNADALQHFGKGYGYINNHDESIDLFRFIPQGPGGTILWTTRDANIVGGLVGVQQGINVGRMELSEARELLERLGCSTITADNLMAANELLERLDGLPLAIAQAATYIRRTTTSIEAYVKMIAKERRRWKLLEKSFFDRHRRSHVPNSVMETWLISMNHILQENPCAYRILHIIAFFDNQGIPFELIHAAATLDNTQEAMDEDECEDNIFIAIARLKEFSFLQVHSNLNQTLPSYEMHRLVQEAIRHMLATEDENQEQPQYSTSALKIMANRFPTGEYGTWGRCEMLLPHALKVTRWPEVSKEKHIIHNLLNRVSMYLFQQGRSKEKEDVDIRALEMRKEVLGEKHPDTLFSMANLATTYYQQGRLKEAEEINIKVLELRKEVLGEKHPNTLNSMASLGVTYGQQGRWKEAEGISIKVLELRKEVLGEKHPDTLFSMANLATTYYQQGRLKEAEEINIKVLELQKEVLGEKHPNTLNSMASLGVTYGQQGRWREAEEIDIKVLELQKEVLGEKHPDTLNSMASLATTYYQQGRLKEAEEIDIKVLELQKEVLGEKHPDTLNSMANLGVTYGQQGRWREAEEIDIKVLELQKEVLGEKHPDTLNSMASLGVTYGQQGRWKEAEGISIKVLELRKEVLGEKHPSTLHSMANLAATYYQQGRLKEAEEISIKVLELWKEVLGEKHPNTLNSMANLAATYHQQGRSKEAKEIEANISRLQMSD